MTFIKVYNRMLNRFKELAGYTPNENSEVGIKLRIMAEEIANMEDILTECQQEEIDKLSDIHIDSIPDGAFAFGEY